LEIADGHVGDDDDVGNVNDFDDEDAGQTAEDSHQPGFKSRSGRGFFSSIGLAGML